MRAFAKAVAALAAVLYLAGGLWAFFAPESFYENIATYPPFNEHFVHDIGAFLLGIGAGALAGLLLSNALAAGLAGVAVASLMHAVSHVVDHDHGGRSTDPWLMGALGVLSLLGFLFALRRQSTVD
jgi:uncharacterized membrane protein